MRKVGHRVLVPEASSAQEQLLLAEGAEELVLVVVMWRWVWVAKMHRSKAAVPAG